MYVQHTDLLQVTVNVPLLSQTHQNNFNVNHHLLYTHITAPKHTIVVISKQISVKSNGQSGIVLSVLKRKFKITEIRLVIKNSSCSGTTIGQLKQYQQTQLPSTTSTLFRDALGEGNILLEISVASICF